MLGWFWIGIDMKLVTDPKAGRAYLRHVAVSRSQLRDHEQEARDMRKFVRRVTCETYLALKAHAPHGYYQAELARLLNRTPAAISRSLDQLTGFEMIEPIDSYGQPVIYRLVISRSRLAMMHTHVVTVACKMHGLIREEQCRLR